MTVSALSDLAPRWPEINALLDQALALAPAERGPWLDALRADAPALADTLRELLAAHAQVETSDFLDTLPPLRRVREHAARNMVATAEPIDLTHAADEPAAGTAVGPYRLLRELGRGGMGAVWLAERADGQLKRQVALKLPRLAWGGALAERLARERDILASLAHPHIARLYDAGVDAIGRPWLALEYVEGRPIDVHCRERGLDTRARVRLLLDVAAAVAYAHSKQVLHRDLKPHNILVTHDGQVRLLDFGIAKLMPDNRAAETALTHALGRMLTPEYASPEQVRGEALSAASDVYSLGVVAFELLSGAKPYRLKRGSAAEIEEAIVAVDAPAASASAVDAVSARALRGDLDAILNQALRKEPGQRYASVAALADDLRRHLEGARVLARPDSFAYRATRLWRAHTLPIVLGVAALAAIGAAIGFGATALLIVVLLSGLAATAWQARRAILQARATAQQAARADAVQHFLVDLLGSAGFGAISAEQRRATTVEQLLERAALQLRERPSPDPQVQEALLDVVAQLFDGLGAHERAIDLWRDLVRRLGGRSGAALQRARVQTALGDALHHASDLTGAIDAYQAALTTLEAAGGGDAAPARAHVQCKLGWEHYIVGDAETGRRLIEAATATDAWQRGDAKLRGDVLRAMAWSAGSAGRLDEAEAALRAAVDADAIGRDAADMVAITRRVDLARLISSLGRHGEAEPLFRAALAPFEAAGETDHPMARHITFHFCRLLAAAGRPTEGMALMRRVLQVVERQPQPLAPMEREVLQIPQAELALADGRIEEAAALYGAGAEAACAIEEPYLASLAWATKARVFAEVGRFGPAMSCSERALELRTKHYGAAHGMVLGCRVAVALVEVAGGNAGAALERVNEVLTVMPARATAERYGSRRDQAECARALCLLDLQRPSEALPIVLEHLPRFAALPAADREPSTDITLHLIAARGLIALQRLDDAWPHLHALDGLMRTLHEHSAQRIPIHGAWAQALAQTNQGAAARERMQRAEQILAAQPSLGPQHRRGLDAARVALDQPGAGDAATSSRVSE